ncbi:ATP-dependent helicase [Sphingopyxis sp.]|uniref:ATP-dependent helicase n=1 Tax=Sphingopyxis sp. TaxID=1908224 RepID=UPI002FCA6C87
MRLIAPDHWRPRGIADLEPNAWAALRHAGSAAIVAGPGAGKTEFLAQRAAYLLETGICPDPFRVLAISFKSDAAENLAARVRRRCPPELANRFTSLTFDAFTKSLVDRFQSAIPAPWRPTRPYEIWFPTRQQTEGHLLDGRLAAPEEWQAEIAELSPLSFESRWVGTYRLPGAPQLPQSGTEFAVDRWWSKMLPAQPRSVMTFTALNRLAELLLRATPHVRRALQLTYPFVFVDEFQDTTYAQYDFLLSTFHGSGAAITAVGDDKQRIMTWAGARPDSFQRIQADFQAMKVPLLFNFRSSPELVQVQHVVARAIEPQASAGISQASRQIDGDAVQVWRSQIRDQEAHHLAQWLTADMQARGRDPRDYVVLVKQKADVFAAELSGRLQEAGLTLRNEALSLGRTTLQDLLSDPAARLAAALLRLGASGRAPEAWRYCSSALPDLRALAAGDVVGQHRAEKELGSFIASLWHDMSGSMPTTANAAELARRAFEFLDLAAIRRSYPDYATGELLDIMIEAFGKHLDASTAGAVDWAAAIDAYEGKDQIPMMTVHKSKGLEYDTVIFIGLDDQAWWAHSPGNPEGLSTFFVALSRAKQRAIFSFCEGRGQRQKVAELFQLLTDAGVPEIVI